MRDRVAYLGSYKRFNIEKCIDKKLKSLIGDEADLHRPLLISLVIPTKIDVGKGTRELELEVLKRTLSECSKLVDLGYIDEIVIIDGSLDERDRVDQSTLIKVVETAYEELDLFRRQVGLIRENRSEAMHARRGFFDFIVRTIHQFDPNIFHVLEKFGVQEKIGLTSIPAGKGAALWLAIPASEGDIVCFLDSDIINFQKEFAVALCDPIVDGFKGGGRQVTMTKACYNRLTMTYEAPKGIYTLGGRVTRLFAIPLLKVLTEEFPEIFRGLGSFKYPLSGEFAVRREFLESLFFPSDYSIEFSILNQSMRRLNPPAVAQIDLDIFYHIGQTVRGLDAMIGQITNRILRTLESDGVTLTKYRKSRIAAKYREKALSIMPRYWNSFNRIKRQVSGVERLRYSKMMDMQRFERFYRHFKHNFLHDPKPEQLILPSWKELSPTINYFALGSMLRRRSNQSTFSRLNDARLL
ncbi:MAG: glycosyltransferase family 2 protein [Candidatus Bathyarchaeia archaeon]